MGGEGCLISVRLARSWRAEAGCCPPLHLLVLGICGVPLRILRGAIRDGWQAAKTIPHEVSRQPELYLMGWGRCAVVGPITWAASSGARVAVQLRV